MQRWQVPNHPHLAATPALLAVARERAEAGFEPAAAALAGAASLAQEAVHMALPEFDHSWFQGKTFADWADIYPQVSRDCTFIPQAPASAALGAALHFAVAGASASLEGARRILLHFANHYRFDIEHYDVGMDYAGWGLQLLYAYDLIYHETASGERDRLDTFFTAWEQAIMANDLAWVKHGWGGLYNNHYAWHSQAIATYGLFYHRPDLVDYAFHSPMGIRACLVHSLVDDGLWFESSTGYNFVAGHAYMMLAWCLRNSGWPEDLFASRYGENKGLRPLYDAALDLLNPDGTLPNVGDCYGRRANLPVFQYEFAYAVYGDPRYAWVLANRERKEKGLGLITGLFAAQELGPQLQPRVATRCWPEHGYALLTQSNAAGYFGSRSAACFVNYGYSGIHNNADRTSIELYAAGQRWLVDAESSASGHSFSAAVQRELNRSTLCHNLVSVDSRDQRSIPHVLELRNFAPDVASITIADAGELYPGVIQERTIILLPNEMLDRFEVIASEPHQYDYQWHFNPGTELELPLDWQPAGPLGKGVEYSWVREAQMAAVAEGELCFTARQEGRALTVMLSIPENAVLLRGYLPRTHDFIPPHHPFLILRVSGACSVIFRARFSWQYSTAG